MQVGGRGDGHRVDALRQQPFHVGIAGAAERTGDEIALPRVGIGYANEAGAREISINPRMVASHDSDADDPYAK